MRVGESWKKDGLLLVLGTELEKVTSLERVQRVRDNVDALSRLRAFGLNCCLVDAKWWFALWTDD